MRSLLLWQRGDEETVALLSAVAATRRVALDPSRADLGLGTASAADGPPTTGDEDVLESFRDASSWSLDPDWVDTFVRFARSSQSDAAPVAADVEGVRAATELVSRRCFADCDLVLAIGAAAIPPLLAAVRPFVAVLADAHLPISPATAEGRLLALALRAAPAVVTLSAGAAEAVRRLGVARAVDLHDLPSAAVAERLEALVRALLDDAEPCHSGFDSLRQKRWELRYESAFAPIYDAQYHASLAYQRMDATLIELLRARLARAGLEAPRLLDLGCGPGSMIPLLQTLPGVEIVGADISPAMIRYARAQHPDVRFVVGDAEHIEFPDASFDVVLCSGILHHLPSLERCVGEITRVLRPGGFLLAREPNVDNFGARHPELAFAHLCLRHALFDAAGEAPIVEPEAHDYHRDFAPPDLVSALEGRLRVEDVRAPLRVAYFYEMIRDPVDFARVDRLEDGLEGQPGLNLVVLARKQEPVGTSPEALASLRALATPVPVPLRHYADLLETIEWAERRAPARPRPDIEERRFEELAPDAAALPRACRRILVTGDGDEEALAREARAFPLAHGDERRVTALPAQAVGPAQRGQFDAVWIHLRHGVPAARLRTLLGACRPYGTIWLDTPRRPCGEKVDLEERDALAALPVFAQAVSSDGERVRALLRPDVFALRDAYQALSVALDVRDRRVPRSGPALGRRLRLLRLRRRLAAHGRRLADAFGHLRLREEGRHLLAFLEA